MESQKAKADSLNRTILNLERIGDESFSSAHNFVHNGRLMNTSTDVSHQSSKNILAAYSFEQQDPVGQEGWDWIQVLAQDTYGYSGTGDTKADRLAAAKANTEKWMEVAADPMSHVDYIMGADVPMLFLRHILEMKAAIDSGNPLTFKSGLPAHMDATTSGIQILAAITKDKISAEIANLLDTDKRTDSYSRVVVEVVKEIQKTPFNKEEGAKAFKTYRSYKDRLSKIATEAKLAEDKVETKELWDKHRALSEEFKAWKAKDNNKDNAARHFWFQQNVREKFRKVFKGPVMTKYYSSGPNGMATSLVAKFGPDKKFAGIDQSLAYWLTEKITKGADKVFKGPGQVLEVMQEIAKEIAGAGQIVQYNNPVSNFPVANDPRVEEAGTIQLKYNGKNKFINDRNKNGIIKSKINYDTEQKNVRKQKTQIAPLVVHSLDAAIVHYMFMHADFPVQTIHDSFATNPANAQKLYELVRKGFYEITKGDVLLDIIGQMYKNAGFTDWKARAQEKFDRTQVGDLETVEGVLNNQYAFSAGVTDPKIAEKIEAEMKVAPSIEEGPSVEQALKTISVSRFETPEAKEMARELKKLFDFNLTEDQAQVIMDSMADLYVGNMPYQVADIVIELRSQKGTTSADAKVGAVKKDSVKNLFSRTYGKFKALIRGTSKSIEVLRSNPLTVIDEFFGNKGKEIYNATFGKLAKAYSKYETESKGVDDKMRVAEEKLAKKFKGNDLAKAKFKMKYYQLQREFESNPNNDEVAAADEWFEATLKDEGFSNNYNEASRKIIEDIKYEFEGKTSDEILSTFTPEVVEALDAMDAVNQRMIPKLKFVSEALRKNPVKTFVNYTHHNTLGNQAELYQTKRTNFTSSTKAGVVNERTPGAKAISLDPFYDVTTANRGLLMDYYMTPVNREVLRTANDLAGKYDSGTKQQRKLLELCSLLSWKC